METETIIIVIQTQIVIIILAQDVIMVIAMEVVRVHVQALIPMGILTRMGTQIRRRNKQHRGEIIVTRVHPRRLLHQTVVRLLLMEVHRVVVVHQVAEVHQAVAVEVEVQDKINKTLTSEIPSNSIFEGIFSFKV